ncbi:uncharacterized protein LOC142042223 [Buteo buteo]|uniref:uncharacterized protein LOC142042223 n=1 Tax=Buteo buteo TaxID=30397 RepID=UPI003EBCEB5E
MPEPCFPSTWSHLRGFREWQKTPGLIDLGGKNPSRTFGPPAGAPKHRDPRQHLCIPLLTAAAADSAGSEDGELCSAPQDGIPLVLPQLSIQKGLRASGTSRSWWFFSSPAAWSSLRSSSLSGRQDTVKQNPGKVKQDLSGMSERDKCPSDLLFCPASQREALTDAEPVLSADVRLTRGRKRSERHLLLLQEEVVIAKLQRGTTLRPQLRLALDQLWVLSGRKEVAGEEKEEEEGSDEDRTSIILIWPTGSCIAAFGSQALKELWVGTLLGTPGGAKRARVTHLPSLRPLEKELSRHHAWRTFSSRSLERLMEGQAEVRPKQGPPTCLSIKAGGLCRSPGAAPQGRTSPGRARTPAGQQPLDVVLRGPRASPAAHSLEEGRAGAGTGCPGGMPALRSLPGGAAGAVVPAAGSLPILPHHSAPCCRQGRLWECWTGCLH